jgi:cytochrome b
MNSATPPASDDTRATAAAPLRRARVWDAPVRVFHWLLSLSLAGAWLSAEADGWRLLHVTLGYTVGGLVAFRMAWGLVGTRHARFSSFVRGPRAVWRYLASLAQGRPEHHLGHNPAGAWAIVAMLGLAALSVGTGWAHLNQLGGRWLEEVHELSGNAWLLLALLHVAAVLLSGRLHGENLVAAMVDGRKRGDPAAGIRRAWRAPGALLLVAVLGFWALQWQRAPELQQALDAQTARLDGDREDHDDDDH